MATAKKTAKKTAKRKTAKRKTAKRKTIARSACAALVKRARKATRKRCAKKVHRAVGKMAVKARKRSASGRFLNPPKKSAAKKGAKKGARKRGAGHALAGRVSRLETKVAAHDHILRSHGMTPRTSMGHSRTMGPTVTPAFRKELARRQAELKALAAAPAPHAPLTIEQRARAASMLQSNPRRGAAAHYFH